MIKRAGALLLLTCTAVLGCGPSSDGGSPDGGSPDGGGGAAASCAPIAETTPTVCSMNAAARNVVFKNGCADPVEIWWVTHACTETFYRRLAPGEMYTQPSFITHPWRARTVPAGGAPMGTVKGMLIKEFGPIPDGAGDLTFTVP
jgi:hypothetical protein